MSPRIAPEERRAAILDAALRCFMRTGYRGTTMDDVVKASGLSKGTIYWYFASKQEIFVTLFDRVILEFMTGTQLASVSESQSRSEQLHQIFSRFAQAAEHSKDKLKLPLNFVIELGQEEFFMQHYRTILQTFVDQVKTLIEAGIATGEFRAVDAHEVAWGLAALYDGLILYYMLDMPGSVAVQIELMSDLIVRGLARTDDL
jgi:AcrR family transcriptional regulator